MEVLKPRQLWNYSSSILRRGGLRCFPFSVVDEPALEYGLCPGDDAALAMVGVIKKIPMASAADLTWDQVLQFRSDKESIAAYRNFHLWLNDFHPKSEREAIDIVGQKLDDTATPSRNTV
jgi:hypothetical protein